jgi:hypothetical protein
LHGLKKTGITSIERDKVADSRNNRDLQNLMKASTGYSDAKKTLKLNFRKLSKFNSSLQAESLN